MNVSQIIFSPTGGTKKVTDIITKAWGMPVNEIDLTNAKTDYTALSMKKEDITVIAVPSYGGRVPALAAQRISQIRGSQAQCVIVCVYGNRAYEDTSPILRSKIFTPESCSHGMRSSAHS